MKKLFLSLTLAAMTLLTTACGGRIETGAVGIRTDFNGTVAAKTEGEGFYLAIVGHVDEYTVKEVAVVLDNLTPKAKDNLSLKELDVTVYYRAKPEFVRSLVVKRVNSSIKVNGSDVRYPSYLFVDSVARSEVADVISKLDSLVIHTQRGKVEDDAKKAIQKSLDSSDPGAFEVTRVVVRQVLTDASIEASIRNVVNKGKELEAAQLGVEIANQNALAVAKTANTLTPAFLQHEYNLALMEFAKNKSTLILDGSASSKQFAIRP